MVRLLKIFISLVVILISIGIIAFFCLFTLELKEANVKINNLPTLISSLSREPSKIVSSDNRDLFILSTEYRKPIRASAIPPIIIEATLAAEDRRFFEHRGIDYVSMLRVLFTNFKAGKIVQGGSTLTMQIAKRLYHSSEKSLSRKLKDLALAVIMERELSKAQILELYLNQVYYGAGAYGIQAAAEVYFGKNIQEITLPEAALLARLVRKPSKENPYINPKKSIENRNFVLKTMYEDKKITLSQYRKSIKTPLHLKDSKQHSHHSYKNAPYFVDYILDTIKYHTHGLDIYEGGYRIETTLNYNIQEYTDRTLNETIKYYKSRKINTGAFLLLDKEGAILTMCGGPSYTESQYNGTTQARRQSGSSFKPFIYAIGIETGKMSINDLISNDKFIWEDKINDTIWAPRNASGKYGGEANISGALAYSLNMPVIRAAEIIGVQNIISLGKSLFGFNIYPRVGLSVALGCTDTTLLEMAKAYSIFMLKGSSFTPFGLKRIIAPDGTVIFENNPHVTQNIISRFTAEYIDDALRAAVLKGTAKRVSSVPNARGKTGTTTNHTDAWFCGYTDELVGISWLANSINTVTGMNRVFGGTMPAEWWKKILLYSQKVIQEKNHPHPIKYEQIIITPPMSNPSEEDSLTSSHQSDFSTNQSNPSSHTSKVVSSKKDTSLKQKQKKIDESHFHDKNTDSTKSSHEDHKTQKKDLPKEKLVVYSSTVF